MKPINNLPRKTFFKEQLGNLKNLTTNIKTDLVSAINWLHSFLLDKLGDSDISTIGNGTVTGAIKQVNSEIGNVLKWNKHSISTIGSNTYHGFLEDYNIKNGSEIKFRVGFEEYYFTYEFIFPVFPETVLYKSLFADLQTDFCVVQYNQWDANDTGGFVIEKLVHNGVNILGDSTIKIELFWR